MGVVHLVTKIIALAIILSFSSAQTVEDLQQTVEVLAKQLSMQQLAAEERVRSEGDSGIKQVRHRLQGDRPYYGETHSGTSVCSMHNHADYIRSIGMGEFTAVLNGVEFRTRHNDYKLQMPSKSSKEYHAVKNIFFPPVPKSVRNMTTVPEQVAEMQEYFLAWKTQNTTHRDYRPHFRAVLCYLEGAWSTQTDKMEETFFSDRHKFDADTWDDMHERIRFTSHTGTKDTKENYSFCPSKLVKLINGTKPVTAQWTYRILCHRLHHDLKLNRLRPVLDMANREAFKPRESSLYKKTSTRFALNTIDADEWGTGFERYQFIDELMGQIPGKNNYHTHLTDSSLGRKAFKYNGKKPGEVLLNAGRYHRVFSEKNRDAMGNYYKHRGFADENLFMAMTTNPMVLEEEVTKCAHGKCKTFSQRWSYAIPLEIIYLTPLSRWNPYGIKYKGHFMSKRGRSVTANGRNGGFTPDKAYDGVSSRYYSITPALFYNSDEIDVDPADTTGGAVGVLNAEGNVVRVRKSGHRIIMAEIPGVGICRQRYPIMPLHVDGNAIMKNVLAMKDHYHPVW